MNVAIGLSADATCPVITESREELPAEIADSLLGLLPLANQRSSCTDRGGRYKWDSPMLSTSTLLAVGMNVRAGRRPSSFFAGCMDMSSNRV